MIVLIPSAPPVPSAFQKNLGALCVSERILCVLCVENPSASRNSDPTSRSIPSAHSAPSAFQKTPVSLCALCALCGKNPYARLISGDTSRNTGANTSDTTAISFSRMFSEGPDVSLNGSPTTSPSTAALCASDPLPP